MSSRIISGALRAVLLTLSLSACSRAYTPLEQEAIKYMKSDLSGLVRAEAAVRSARGRYTADPEAAGYIRSLGVDLPVVKVDGDGWSATVTATHVPGVRCAVAVDARNPLKSSAESGQVVCE